MRKIAKTLVFSLLIACMIQVPMESRAQIPTNLSNIKASQISDAQLMQFLQQAQSTGMTEDQLMQEFKKRGLAESELEILVGRIGKLTGSSITIDEEESKTENDGKRKYKEESKLIKVPLKPSRVFGADLFSGADPLFVPNLKIATPKGYIIGGEDQIQLEIYGNNVSSQKLLVSPDGYVNVKHAGPINFSGLTIEQAAGILKGKLLKYYPSLSSGATQLQLTLGSVRSIQVTIVGAVKRPGTITLPSVATLFNALYSSGGPADNGSFRAVELVRNNKIIAKADLYDFILKGDQSSNLTLQDNDVIRVPFVKRQVVLEGELNRVGIFEVKEEESLQDVLEYAGGFKGNAFKERITGTRYTDIERSVIDVPKSNFATFQFNHGDSLYIDSVINRYANRVFISGSVFKPGAYALEKEMDVFDLIKKAQGLKEDAYLGRANMVRLRDNFTKEYKSVNLFEIMSGDLELPLRKEDSLHVVSILDIRDSSWVTIAGPIKKPGNYKFEDSLTLQSILLQAGGFLENASPAKVEIGRRKSNQIPNSKGEKTSEIITVDLQKDLKLAGDDIFLKPFDIISIKSDPTKVSQINIKISGEVVYVGNYTLTDPEERLSSIVKRAGGLLPYADIDGAKLLRKKKEVDSAEINRLVMANIKLSSISGSRSSNDSASLVAIEELKKETVEVALDLSRILRNPNSEDDIFLQEGDELIVPKFINTVTVSGEVLKPVTVQFEKGRKFGRYLSAAGGFSKNAYKRRVFAAYANGRSAKSYNFFGVKVFPKVKPGSTFFVPTKPDTKGFDSAKAGIFISALTAVSTILVLLYR